ncbi:MAG: FAD:protein FMN transferase [Candidatus Fimousia sp.]
MKAFLKRKAYCLGCIVVIVICLTAVCLFSSLLHHSNNISQKETTTELFAMDTYITMTAYGEDAGKALSEVEYKLTELEKLWSVTDSESDIYAVNHNNGQATMVSEETEVLLSFVLQMSEETNGALDPTIYPVLTAWGFTTDEKRIPSDTEITDLLRYVGYQHVKLEDRNVLLAEGMMLDIGAVGKGYASDLAAQILRDNGINSALLDFGGNIQTVGEKPDGSPWRIGVRDPLSSDTLGVLEISNMAVVTSGNYERYFIGEDGKQYGHIIDPVTCYPVENGLASVTVISEEGRLCDALSTSLFVMGLDNAIEYWKEHQNFEMILITDNREIYLTDGIKDVFSLDSHHNNMKVNVIENE